MIINGVTIDATFAEAFPMKATRAIITAQNEKWAMISAQANYTFEQAKNDRTYWGRLVESAIGTHLINNKPEASSLHYWRESPNEVDFVLKWGNKLLAIEVKSGEGFAFPKGLGVFVEKFKNVTPMLVGDGGVAISDFLLQPVEHWLN